MLSFAFGLLRGVAPLLGGFFTGGGSLAWSFLQGLWGTEIGRTVIIGFGLFVVGWALGFNHEHSVKIAAVEVATKARDAEWSQTIAKANQAAEQRIQEALNAARNVPPTPPAGASLIELCRQSSSCRGAFVKRLVVQAPKSNVDARR